jgi:hypothetical protein
MSSSSAVSGFEVPMRASDPFLELQIHRTSRYFMVRPLKRNDFKLNQHVALAFCLSMIFSENRYPLSRIML